MAQNRAALQPEKDAGGAMTNELIDIETLYHGWLKLLRAKLRQTDGQMIEREIEDHGEAACVLPYDPKARTAMLVRQFRAPVLYTAGQDSTLEAIAGILEAESPAACAEREAMEEAGVTLHRIEPVIVAWSMPGVSTERMHFFLAQYRAGAPLHDRSAEDEAVEVVEMALDDVARSADAGRLNDLKTLFLVQTLRLRQPHLFR
jgi:nudix-type nucleoside diphosphatase (YffH/AdpP family)